MLSIYVFVKKQITLNYTSQNVYLKRNIISKLFQLSFTQLL